MLRSRTCGLSGGFPCGVTCHHEYAVVPAVEIRQVLQGNGTPCAPSTASERTLTSAGVAVLPSVCGLCGGERELSAVLAWEAAPPALPAASPALPARGGACSHLARLDGNAFSPELGSLLERCLGGADGRPSGRCSSHLATKRFIVGAMPQPAYIAGKAQWGYNTSTCKGGSLPSASTARQLLIAPELDRGSGRPGRLPSRAGTTPLSAARSSRRTVEQPPAAHRT